MKKLDIVYNWHITEKCNYACEFCFSEWNKKEEIFKNNKNVSKILSELSNSNQIESLKNIRKSIKSNTVRINFAGGEPLLLGNRLIEIAKEAKEKGLETSLITNGSYLLKYKEVAKVMSLIGISVDSLDPETNLKIGRSTKQKDLLKYNDLAEIVNTLRKLNPGIEIKFNVVVNEHNYNEILIPKLEELNPVKITVFKVIPFGKKKKGITDEMYNNFISINKPSKTMLFYENNEDMVNSYLMIDPLGRFFENGNGDDYGYSKPIYQVGLENAFNSIKFDIRKFLKRY